MCLQSPAVMPIAVGWLNPPGCIGTIGLVDSEHQAVSAAMLRGSIDTERHVSAATALVEMSSSVEAVPEGGP